MESAIFGLARALAADPGVTPETREAAAAILVEADEEVAFWEQAAAADAAIRNGSR